MIEGWNDGRLEAVFATFDENIVVRTDPSWPERVWFGREHVLVVVLLAARAGRVIMVEFFIDDEALRAELGIGPRPRRQTSSATPG